MEPFKSCGLKEHLDSLKCNFSPGSSLRIVYASAKKKNCTGNCVLRCFFFFLTCEFETPPLTGGFLELA